MTVQNIGVGKKITLNILGILLPKLLMLFGKLVLVMCLHRGKDLNMCRVTLHVAEYQISGSNVAILRWHRHKKLP
jgi:hypothetical protein